MILTYLYTSFATNPVDLNPDLSRILSVARKRNPELGISGFLLYVDGVFAQCLEGSGEAVGMLAHRIEQDPAHSSVTVLRAATVQDRLFSTWDMGFYMPTSLTDRRAMARVLRSGDADQVMALLETAEDKARGIRTRMASAQSSGHGSERGLPSP